MTAYAPQAANHFAVRTRIVVGLLFVWFTCLPSWTLAQEAKVETNVAADQIDLLRRIDLKRDVVLGEFRLEKGMLIAPTSLNARLTLQYEPPLNYDLVVDVKRPEKDGSLALILVLDGKQVLVMLDAFWMKASGVTLLDNLDLDAKANETAYRQPVLPVGEKTQVRFEIRGPKLKIQVGAKTILNWEGKNSRTSIPKFWAIPNAKALMIGSCTTPFEISRLELTPVAPTTPDQTAVASPTPIAGSLAVAKIAFPSSTQQADARKTIRELFKKEFELAKFAKGRVALAETLLSRAAELQDDKTGLYALLAEAAEIAAAAGDLPLALKAVAEVDQYFGTPAFELKEKVGKILIPLAKSPEQILHVIELELTIFREALSQDEIELAERSLQVAQTLSRKPGMAILKDQMNVVTKEFSSIKAAFQTVDDARQTLRTKPDDRTANLAWGKYLCFIKGDWTNGLPFLMKSQSAPLAALAKRDLERPTDPDANVLLGDEWCTIGELEKEPARTNICLHATEAYNRGLPGLTGLNLSLTEGKLSRLFGDSEIFASNGDPQGTLLADAALNFSSAGTVECWVQTRVTEGVLFSKRGVEPEGSLGIRLYQGQACLMENASYHYRESRTELTINDGNWHHVAIVKAGKNAAFFFDGKLVATLQVRDQLISKSPWKLGTCCGHAPIAVKACKFRISNTARYFVSFKPEYNYKKDKATVFISDPK